MEEEKKKSPNERKCELASAWSLHMFDALNNKLEKALNGDIDKTQASF